MQQHQPPSGILKNPNGKSLSLILHVLSLLFYHFILCFFPKWFFFFPLLSCLLNSFRLHFCFCFHFSFYWFGNILIFIVSEFSEAYLNLNSKVNILTYFSNNTRSSDSLGLHVIVVQCFSLFFNSTNYILLFFI